MIEEMAAIIHAARWPEDRQDRVTPFAEEDRSGREYCLRIARAVLASHPTDAGLVETWQPIDTAPRDRTWFLACATAPGWGATRIVHFRHPDDRLPIHGEGQMWPSPPTHWMPLPAKPALTPNDDHCGSGNGEEGHE